MPSSLMYQEDNFVILETNQPEQILTAQELREKLKAILVSRQDTLPTYLQGYSSVDAQVDYLLNTCCDLDLGPGEFWQWYAVRLEK